MGEAREVDTGVSTRVNSVLDSGISRGVMESDGGSAAMSAGRTEWSNGGPSVGVAEGSSLFGAGVSHLLAAGSTAIVTLWN